MRLLILTGMSGAGKSTALKMLEDMGYYCVDNLPIQLLTSFVDLSDRQEFKRQRVVVGIDIRSGETLSLLSDILSELEQDGKKVDVLFMDAEEDVLVNRYKETRRTHPLSQSERIYTGIEKERQAMQFLKERADYIIDIGPEGGDRGGTIVACGTPEEVAANEKSYTGKYIDEMLKRK